jgi:predicted XRE-type DNA-binding protein
MKNFTVKTERIKSKSGGTSSYLNYLNNEKHPHHEDQTMMALHNNPSYFLNKCSQNALGKDLQTIENRKGGRMVESYCQSFCFSFPPGINVTEESLKKDSEEIINTFKENFPLIKDDEIYINAHLGGKNPHLNVLVARVNYDQESKEYVNNLKLDQKGITHKCKLKFNEIMKNNYQLDVKDYTPERTNCKEKLWSTRNKKAKELEEKINKMEEINNKLNTRALEQKTIIETNMTTINEQSSLIEQQTKESNELKVKNKSLNDMNSMRLNIQKQRKEPTIKEDIFKNDEITTNYIKKDIKKDGLGF